MIKSKTVVAELRRDVTYLGRAVVAIVFLGFAGLALAAAVIDLWRSSMN